MKEMTPVESINDKMTALKPRRANRVDTDWNTRHASHRNETSKLRLEVAEKDGKIGKLKEELAVQSRASEIIVDMMSKKQDDANNKVLTKNQAIVDNIQTQIGYYKNVSTAFYHSSLVIIPISALVGYFSEVAAISITGALVATGAVVLGTAYNVFASNLRKIAYHNT